MKRAFPLLLITAGILLTTGATAWAYFNNLTRQPQAVYLPDSIAGLQITDSKSGAPAVADFEDLHGKQFPITSGSIGIYGHQQITLWAAGVPSEAVASNMTYAMREKIAKGNSPFIPLSEVNDENRKVYVLEGMGQKHYYFRSNNLVIWLAADPAIADAAIQQVLEVYP